MEKPLEIHAYHGWGFGPDFWTPLQSCIPETIPFKVANRGYVNSPFIPRFEPLRSVKVVFVHSFGFHWCNTAVLSKADVIVLFNSFVEFIPPGNKAASKKLELTIQAFRDHPLEVWHQFREHAFSPNQSSFTAGESADTGLLLHDLKQLKSTRYPMIDLDSLPLMVAIDSGQDHILDAPRGGDLLSGYVGKKEHLVFENDGHALPFVKAEECWSYLCSVVPIFGWHENNRSAST
ncbi:MAG: hypothetical protein AAFW89_09540 [Bacteroidota bacterium]